MKMKQLAVSLITASACFTAGAADFANFPPTELPHGYIAPIALSQYNVSDGNAKLFRPWFSNTKHYGDLKSYTLSSLGIVSNTHNWSAKEQLETLTTGTGWQSRKLFTVNNTGAVVTYSCTTTATTNGAALKRFICGDRTEEPTKRVRTAILGDIVHSQPVYVGPPRDGHALTGYPAFVSAHKNRAGRVYVGANDGMLHAFDASTGDEVFAYIPFPVKANLANLEDTSYSHNYFVDGQLSVADAYTDFNGSGNEWASVLVGTLGAGGKGLFALNVTDPTASNLAAAKAKFLWEYTSVTNANLGYTYGKPVIAKLSTGKWGVITGNGYKNSGDGKAHLLILPIKTGDFTPIDIPLGSSTANGLSAPAVIDADGDGLVDTVYAGDLEGNLWKVDIGHKTDTNQWGIPAILGSNALLTTSDINNNPQPILSAPEVAKNPSGGVRVYVGTGDLIASSGALGNADSHSVYGVVDAGTLTQAITRPSLQRQTLTDISGQPNYRTLTTDTPVVDALGWVLDLAADEHVLQAPLVRDSRLQLMVTDQVNEKNWLTQVDYLTGGLPDKVVFDLNYDGLLTAADNAGYDADDPVNSPGTPVVAINKDGDLLSRAVVARNAYNDLAYTNRWWSSVSSSGGPDPVLEHAADDAQDVVDALPPIVGDPVVTAANAHCSRIFMDDFESTNDASNFGVIVTVTLENGTIIKGQHLNLPKKPWTGFDPVANPSGGFYPLGDGAGIDPDGNPVTWFGLNMTVHIPDGTDAADDMDLKIFYNSPYKITSLTINTPNYNFERYHDGNAVSSWSIADQSSKTCSGSEINSFRDDEGRFSNGVVNKTDNKNHYLSAEGVVTFNTGRIEVAGTPSTQAEIDAYNAAVAAAAAARAAADAAAAGGDPERDFDGDGILDKDDDNDDGDTLMDWEDDDDDNDGIKDWEDRDNKNDKDKDKDGIEDKYEDDDDNGIMNKDEDDDGDGEINDTDADYEGNIEETEAGDNGGVSVNVQSGNTELLGRIRWRELLF